LIPLREARFWPFYFVVACSKIRLTARTLTGAQPTVTRATGSKPEQFEERLEDFLRRRVAQAEAGDMSPQSVSDIWTEVRDRRSH
jgi:hypothetical protein